MIDVQKFEDIDLYKLLKIDNTANESEIRRAYRKRALLCHPDKNPNNPKANEQFHQLSEALEILSDKSLRDECDRLLKAKKTESTRTTFNTNFESTRPNFNANFTSTPPNFNANFQFNWGTGFGLLEKVGKVLKQMRKKQKAEFLAQKRSINKRKKFIKDVMSACKKSMVHLKRSQEQRIKTMPKFDRKLFVKAAEIGPTYVNLIEDMSAKYAESIQTLKRTNAEIIQDFANSIENLKWI